MVDFEDIDGKLVQSGVSSQVSSQLDTSSIRGATTDTEKLGGSIKNVANDVENLNQKLRNLGITVKEDTGVTNEMYDAMEKLGIKFEKVSQENVAAMSTNLAVLKENFKALPEDIQKQVEKMEKDLGRLSGIAEKEASKMGEALKRGATGASKSVTQAVQSELSDVIPAPLMQFGIWGLLIGSFVGAQEYLRANAAKVVSSFERAGGSVSKGILGVGGSIDDVQKSMQAFEKEWMFVLDKAEMTEIWSEAAVAVEGYSSSIESNLSLMHKMAEASIEVDMVMGQKYGTTMNRVNGLFVEYGRNVQQSLKDMQGLKGAFLDNVGPTNMWLQSVMDIQSRLGVLGVDLQNVASVFDIMGEASTRAGGGQAQARAATGELMGMFGKVGLPFQAMMGRGLAPGASPMGQIMEYQKLINLDQEGFGKKMPEMMAGLFDQLGLIGMGKEETFGRLTAMKDQLGFSEKTVLLLTDVLSGVDSPKGLIKELDSHKEIQKSFKDDTKSLKDTIENTIPAWTKLLQSLVKLLVEVLNMLGSISSSMAIMGMSMMPGGLSPQQAAGLILKDVKQRGSTIAGLAGEMGMAGAQLVPGGALLSEAMQKDTAARRGGGFSSYMPSGSSGGLFNTLTSPGRAIGGLFSDSGEGADTGGTISGGGTALSGNGGGFFGNMGSMLSGIGGADSLTGAPAPGGMMGNSSKVTVAGGDVVISGNFSLALSESEARQLNDALAKTGNRSKPEASATR